MTANMQGRGNTALLSLEPFPDILFIPRTLRQGAAVLRGNVKGIATYVQVAA